MGEIRHLAASVLVGMARMGLVYRPFSETRYFGNGCLFDLV